MSRLLKVHIVGGGPAGTAASLAALQQGAAVTLIEKSTLPRHKVCGEFLSPGIVQAFEALGLWPDFLNQKPSEIRRMSIRIGRRLLQSNLPEVAFGLSRYRFDAMLFEAAKRAGAAVARESSEPPQIVSVGRTTSVTKGDRLFGFKAHYHGPQSDSVELFFTGGYYVGINCVEDGITNICGLARESTLKAAGFEPDELIERSPELRDRVQPLQRSMNWMFTGPVAFRHRFQEKESTAYFAGDALSFVDPFTGTGLLSAVLTGTLAGAHAARNSPVPLYLEDCRRALSAPFHVSSILRKLAMTRAAETLVRLVPGEWLYRWTRPRMVA